VTLRQDAGIVGTLRRRNGPTPLLPARRSNGGATRSAGLTGPRGNGCSAAHRIHRTIGA